MPIQIKERVMYDITDLDQEDLALLYQALDALLENSKEDADANDRIITMMEGLKAVVED